MTLIGEGTHSLMLERNRLQLHSVVTNFFADGNVSKQGQRQTHTNSLIPTIVVKRTLPVFSEFRVGRC